MRQPSFIIITHGSISLGMGHFTRSKSISHYLTKNNEHGIFFVNDNLESRSFFHDCDNTFFYSSERNFDVIRPFLALKPLIIFDCNNTLEEEVLFCKDFGCNVVTFDDLGTGEKVCDLSINANISLKSASKKHLFGEDYIWLSESYIDFSSQKRVSSRTKKILISLGGYDQKKFSLTLLRGIFYSFYFSLYETFEIHIKLPAVKHDIYSIFNEAEFYHDLEIEQNGNQYKILIDDMKELMLYTYDSIADMPRLISDSDILFTSGGITVYEGLTAGTYTLAFPQTPEEKTVINRLLRKGYLPAKIDTSRLQEDLEYIFELSEVEFSSFLRKSRESFDGRGSQRIGEALMALTR